MAEVKIDILDRQITIELGKNMFIRIGLISICIIFVHDSYYVARASELSIIRLIGITFLFEDLNIDTLHYEKN